MTIPVIDFSNLNGDKRAQTMAEIANCCEKWGFFQLVNHGIREELLERVKKVCSDCYKMEREDNFFKNSNPVRLLKELPNDGSKLENVDWEDVFTLMDTAAWPVKTLKFKETMAEYRSQLKKLAEKVAELMDENLGLPKGYIKNALNGGEGEDKAFFGTKVSHYPPCPRPEAVNGLRAHTDAGGVILLFQDDAVKGLQCLKDGEWIDVQPLRNAIVVNTGDQIEVLSNGRYKSVWHRILVTPDGNRRSVASFYNPSLGATIAPAPQLLAEKAEEVVKKKKVEMEEEHNNKEVLVYPKFVFGDYMSVYAERKFLPKEPRFKAVRAM